MIISIVLLVIYMVMNSLNCFFDIGYKFDKENLLYSNDDFYHIKQLFMKFIGSLLLYLYKHN